MKSWIYGVLAASLCAASNAYAAQNGVNYDPAHSAAYVSAQQKNDAATMTAVIADDLTQLRTLGFSLVKTFYSTYCTINGQKCVSIAELATARNMRLMLGVFEFPDHPDWTQSQVDAAVDAAFRYPGTVVAIAVGNEDMFDWQGTPQPAMQKRIVADMTAIRTRINNPKVVVTTAQREPDWMRLVASDPQKVLQNVTVIGANIYPFWGGSSEKINGKSVANNIQAAVANLRGKTAKPVIVTEEGWPSCGNNAGMKDMNIDAEIDYFSTWKTRPHDFDSYYFAAYNNISAGACQNDDANNHFGLCSAAGLTKDVRLLKCK